MRPYARCQRRSCHRQVCSPPRQICPIIRTHRFLSRSAVKGIQSVRVQQHFVQYAGEDMNAIQQPLPRNSGDEHQMPATNPAVVKPASAPSAISSSSAVITSSASNHSFALSEQNDEKSSSQCSRKNPGAAAGAQKTDGSGSSTAIVRHTNKYLTESSIRLIELRCPGMTTHERVLNWKVADEFSDFEDDFDESRYTQSQPFRSERVSKTAKFAVLPQHRYVIENDIFFSCKSAFIRSPCRRRRHQHRRHRLRSHRSVQNQTKYRRNTKVQWRK